MYRGILFDFDGTLADTAITIIKRFHEVFQECGYPDVTDKQIKDTIGLPLDTSFMILQPSIDEKRAKELCEVYRIGYEKTALSLLQAYPGTKDVLNHFREQGFKMAVTSSKKTDIIVKMIAKLGFNSYFDALLGEDTVMHKKPAPDMALKAMELLNLKPEETIVVGDSKYDIEMGNAAGCTTIYALYGYGDPQIVAQAEPKAVVTDIYELIGVIGQ